MGLKQPNFQDEELIIGEMQAVGVVFQKQDILSLLKRMRNMSMLRFSINHLLTRRIPITKPKNLNKNVTKSPRRKKKTFLDDSEFLDLKGAHLSPDIESKSEKIQNERLSKRDRSYIPENLRINNNQYSENKTINLYANRELRFESFSKAIQKEMDKLKVENENLEHVIEEEEENPS